MHLRNLNRFHNRKGGSKDSRIGDMCILEASTSLNNRIEGLKEESSGDISIKEALIGLNLIGKMILKEVCSGDMSIIKP